MKIKMLKQIKFRVNLRSVVYYSLLAFFASVVINGCSSQEKNPPKTIQSSGILTARCLSYSYNYTEVEDYAGESFEICNGTDVVFRASADYLSFISASQDDAGETDDGITPRDIDGDMIPDLIMERNSNEIHHNVGSLKKVLIAYCALAIDANYQYKIFNGMTFNDFLKRSDDGYAAALLRDLMIALEREFAVILENDLGIPMISLTDDAYFDRKPDPASYSKPLDKKNEIYRYSIGQQKPYPFLKVIEWYSRIAAGRKITPNYSSRQRSGDELSIEADRLAVLRRALNGALSGTAAGVGNALKQNRIRTDELIAKTGTAESEGGQFNTSSSIVVTGPEHTIGIMLSGRIPSNSDHVAAKDLMITILPILKIRSNIGRPLISRHYTGLFNCIRRGPAIGLGAVA